MNRVMAAKVDEESQRMQNGIPRWSKAATMPRITVIQHQHVLAAQWVKAFEQHLPFADQRAVQDVRIEQLNAWAKQGEQGGLLDAALALRVEQGQAHLGSVGGQNPQSQPKRLSGNVLVDQTQQFIIERIQDIGPKAAARLRESAGGDHATQAGSPLQQGKESIRLGLHCPTDAGEQKSDQAEEGQIAVASEILGVWRAASRNTAL